MKRIANFKAVIAMMVVWTLFLTPLSPMVQQAAGQTKSTKTEYKPSATPGTSDYYRNPKVRGEILDFMRKNKLKVGTPKELKIGGNPQVDKTLGETIAAPQSDEEDVLVNDILTETGKEFIELETVSRSGRLYVYRITKDYKDINGELITVRRNKVTKQIYLTINCGNITWEVGAGYEPITPDPVNECPNFNPNPSPVPNKNDKGEIISYTYDFKCGQPVTVEVQVRKEDCPDCKPGLYKPVLLNRGAGNEDASKSLIGSMKAVRTGNSFSIREALIAKFGATTKTDAKQTAFDWELVLKQMEKDREGIGDLKAKYFDLWVDPCATALGTHNVLFRILEDDDQPPAVKKKKWWKNPLLWIAAIAGGIVVAILLGNGKTLVKPVPPIRITPP